METKSVQVGGIRITLAEFHALPAGHALRRAALRDAAAHARFRFALKASAGSARLFSAVKRLAESQKAAA
jgi:hypothetical protein